MADQADDLETTPVELDPRATLADAGIDDASAGDDDADDPEDIRSGRIVATALAAHAEALNKSVDDLTTDERLAAIEAYVNEHPDEDAVLTDARIRDMAARGVRIHEGKPAPTDPLGQASTVERIRQRSAVGAMGMAMGLAFDQVFGRDHKKEPAIVLEAAGDPYDDDDPVVVDYVNEDAQATTVSVRPWLLPKIAADRTDGADA